MAHDSSSLSNRAHPLNANDRAIESCVGPKTICLYSFGFGGLSGFGIFKRLLHVFRTHFSRICVAIVSCKYSKGFEINKLIAIRIFINN